MKTIIISFVLMLITGQVLNKPNVCSIGKDYPEIHVTKSNAAISIDDEIVYNDPAFSVPRMGGKRGNLNCTDIHISKNLIIMRYGHNKDLVLLFAIEYYPNGDVKKIYRHFDRLQDGDNIIIRFANSGDALVKYGRNHDINKRYTFDFIKKTFLASRPNRVHETGIDSYYTANIPIGTELVLSK